MMMMMVSSALFALTRILPSILDLDWFDGRPAAESDTYASSSHPAVEDRRAEFFCLTTTIRGPCMLLPFHGITSNTDTSNSTRLLLLLQLKLNNPSRRIHLLHLKETNLAQ